MMALDRNQDGRITRDELAQAPKSLLTLDRNQDGKLTEEEVRPERPPGGPPVDRGADLAPPPGDFGSMIVSSPAFKNGGLYPTDFTCDGAGVSPPIDWKNAPEGTKSFAISIWHVPGPGDIKSYWVVYNIPASVTGLPRASQGIGTEGMNDKRHGSYDPMCSKGPGLKTYHITVYALSKELTLAPGRTTRAELLNAIKEITLAQKTLSYQYERTDQERTPSSMPD
jgi:Raf kinase inhibitor-like YbhB/YbcL family protein